MAFVPQLCCFGYVDCESHSGTKQINQECLQGLNFVLVFTAIAEPHVVQLGTAGKVNTGGVTYAACNHSPKVLTKGIDCPVDKLKLKIKWLFFVIAQPVNHGIHNAGHSREAPETSYP
jgi:hypothetical protein